MEYAESSETPKYPGLGYDLRYTFDDKGDHEYYPIGAHGSCPGSQSGLLPVRELAMMSIMDSLTDKPDWHKKVFDDEIVAKWNEEALTISDDDLWNLAVSGKSQYWHGDNVRFMDDWTGENQLNGQCILSKAAFDYCIMELQAKATSFERSGIVLTLDAFACVAKSDSLVSRELHESLSQAIERLKMDQCSSPDWHPNSNNMVQDLVHPSMFPLIYGRTPVLKEEVVGVYDAVDAWAGKGTVAPKGEFLYDPKRDYNWRWVGGGEIPPHFWSDTYQWLPANVAFQDDGSVKFTSYINNLHPKKYAHIYRAVEKLIETSIPAWDQCLHLIEGDGAGILGSRFTLPDDPDDENVDNWVPSEIDCQEVRSAQVSEGDMEEEGWDPEEEDETYRLECKWRVIRQAKIPEPDEFVEIENTTAADIRIANKLLSEKFKSSGLQVIVKMASIELTPEKPEFPAGAWHVEGQMNEHICATALYYTDCENITPSNISFRMQTSAYLHQDLEVGQDAYHWMEKIFGTHLERGSPCLQNYGSVETRQGRLLAFPNVFQHRVSSFKLVDATKPGHRRFIALWLVDPHKRIISTANVPPQQQDWWIESILGSSTHTRMNAMSKIPTEVLMLLGEKDIGSRIVSRDAKSLPPELMDIVREHLYAKEHELPMTLEEAKEHRVKLMNVRSGYHQEAEHYWQRHSYNFCEH